MIQFLPETQNGFFFSDLFTQLKGEYLPREIKSYPFSNLRYYFWDKKKLPDYIGLDERNIEEFGMFKEIFLRGDNFYLIACKYFEQKQIYSYDHKILGILVVKDIRNSGVEISFFDVVYNSLQLERKKGKSLLRQEFILSKSKSKYINSLSKYLLADYGELDSAIRKNQNTFYQYGSIIKEVYLQIFRDFNSNFIDYLSDENFGRIKNLVYPSSKEVQSFKFAKRKNWSNPDGEDSRRMVINSILQKLQELNYIDSTTTHEQVDDLFNNKRREHEKIIWLKDLTSLHTFLKILQEKEIIEDAEDKHWIILADYFTLSASEISFKELKDKKRSTNYKVNEDIAEVVHFVTNVLYC